MLRLAGRQIETLRRDVDAGRQPVTVIIDDGQPVAELIYGLVGRSDVPLFRMTDGLFAVPSLIDGVRGAAAAADWLVIYAGGTFCPPALVELMRFVAGQEFRLPRFITVVERLDLAWASPELAEVAALGRLIDLTADRDTAYFREIVTEPELEQRTVTLIVDLFERLRSGPLPDLTTRSLERACSAAAWGGVERGAELAFLGRLRPGPEHDAAEKIIKEALRG